VANQQWNGKPAEDGDRAVLLQSEAHYDELAIQFPHLAKEIRANSGEAGFGENILVKGMPNTDSACIGDIISVSNSTLILQVSSPRRPCSRVDSKYGRIFSNKGVRKYVAETGTGGLFCRILKYGELRIGDVLQIESCLHPGWTLRRTARMLYTDAPSTYKDLKWQGTREELVDLLNISELAKDEWRDEVVTIARKAGIYKSGRSVLAFILVVVFLCIAIYLGNYFR